MRFFGRGAGGGERANPLLMKFWTFQSVCYGPLLTEVFHWKEGAFAKALHGLRKLPEARAFMPAHFTDEEMEAHTRERPA